jgi:hypothetical protein
MSDKILKSKQLLEDFIGVKLEMAPTVIVEINTFEKIEEEKFVNIIEQIENLFDAESDISLIYGINIQHVAEPYWVIIEELVHITYPKHFKLITWYLFERKDIDNQIKAYIDSEMNEHIINNPQELYKFIKK